MENKVLPCPFCGAEMGLGEPEFGKHWIHPWNGCRLDGHHAWDEPNANDECSLSKWNTRHQENSE